MKFFQAICIFLVVVLQKAACDTKCPSSKYVVCYWASWSSYRPADGNFKIGLIIPEYCTHIIYTFAGLNIDGEIISLDPDLDIQNKGYKDLIALKEQDPSGCLKIILAIGGWNEGSEKYSLMAESAANREKFAESVLRFLVFYGFDGIDIDWEYPTQRKGLPADRRNFTELIKALLAKLTPRNRTVSAAVTAGLNVTKAAYEVSRICHLLDFVSIMGYDFQDQNLTSIHSPLKPELGETRQTISTTVNYYKRNGCPAEKIILGVPAYGRTYTLRNARISNLGAPTSGLGEAGEYTQESGLLGYNEICEMQNKQSGWKKVYLDKNAAVYAFHDKLWVSYDDDVTLEQKAQYVVKKGLGGIMMWSIDMDDFRGNCTNGLAYPLLYVINKYLGREVNISKR